MDVSISDQLLADENKQPTVKDKALENTAKKLGDEGYVAPELKEGDEGYVPPAPKPGDANYKKPELKPGDEGYKAPTDTESDVDDEKLLAYLQKKNPKIKSLADVLEKAPELTEAQKAANAEERKSKMLVFGLKSGAIKNDEQYRGYITDLNKPARDIALEAYKAAALLDDPDADEADIIKDFEDEHFEHLAETDKRRIRAAKNMEAAKENYINEKYESIVNLEEEYDYAVETEEKQTVYVSRVDKIISEIPAELPFDVTVGGKTHTYQYKVKPETLTAIKELYKGKEHFALFNQGNVEDEALKQTMLNSLQAKEFKNIIQEMAHAHATALLNAAKKGRRGDFPDRDEAGEGHAVGGGGISDQIINEQKN